MHSEGTKAFWKAFAITLALMAPVLIWTAAAGLLQPQEAASSQTGVPVREPGEENRLTALIVLADDPPAFVLVRLDAPANRLSMAVAPAQSVVKNGQEALTLAESYAVAGPARAAQLLGGTLNLSIDRYLAAAPELWVGLFNEAGTARFGLSGALTAGQLAQAGTPGEVQEWTASAARGLLEKLETSADPALGPAAAAPARAAVWQAWARQQLDVLPQLLPDTLRAHSGALLTNLSATDLLTLGETLEFLADGGAAPQAQVLPGSWSEDGKRYAFSDDTLAAVQALFSTEASSGASSGRSVP